MTKEFNPIEAIRDSDLEFRRETAKAFGWIIAGGCVVISGVKFDNAFMIYSGMTACIPAMRSLRSMNTQTVVRDQLFSDIVEDLARPEPLQE